jgi:hypothetical protein
LATVVRSLRTLLAPYVPRGQAEASKLAIFLVATLYLDTLFNLRFPQPELHLWYLLPSVDVVVILGAFAIVGSQGWRIPKLAYAALVALVMLVRVLRFGDGIQDRYYAQKFTLYDLASLPEGVRFAHSALSAWKFWPLLVAALVLLVLLPVLAYLALRVAATYLAETRRVPLVAVLAFVAFLVGLGQPRKAHHPKLFQGGFGTSAGPRIRREATFLLNLVTERGKWSQAIVRADEQLRRTPADLSKLRRKSVHFILVESYGIVALERPEFVRTLTPLFSSIESRLGERGFTIASGRMTSPTFGGRSWLAHATLATSVPTTSQLGYDIVFATKPKTLAAFFREAGYRTVLAAPGTTREGNRGDLYDFTKNYYFWDFEYEGPAFAWATMPDQYVFDLIRRRELTTKMPLFVQYVLVSSHAPWSETPSVVSDWSKLGNGAIFDTHPVYRYPIVWPDFTNAHDAYIRSIAYDFEIIGQFIEQFLTDDSLIIVLGDHQPVIEVSGNESDHRVPIHIFSRDKSLVEPFMARGYVPGLWPKGQATARAFETFLPDLLRDFSAEKAH